MASKYENYTAFEPETIAFLDGLDNQEEDSELDSLEVGELTDSTEPDGDTSEEGNSEEEIEEVNELVDNIFNQYNIAKENPPPPQRSRCRCAC